MDGKRRSPRRTGHRTGLSLLVVGMLAACVWLSSSATPSGASSKGSLVTDNSLAPHGQIGHQGRWLVDSTGRVLLFHGINEVEKSPPYYPSADGFSDADAAWLADNGIRVVRVGVLATGLMPKPGVISRSYLAHIAATVSDLHRHGIYSLIDFHQDGWGPTVGSDGFPASMTVTGTAVNNHVGFPLYYVDDPATQQAFQSFWDDAIGADGRPLQDDYVAMFTAVARAFANRPYVLGYDLFNEPWPGTTWQACATDPDGCPALDASELGPLYAKAVEGIRSTGDSHLIFGEPFSLFNFGISTTSMPLPGNDPESGMSFHMYTLSPAQEPAVLTNAVAWSQQTGGALLNTEWGAVTTSSDIERQSLELDTALLPWIFWSMGEVVNNPALPPSGTNLVASTVDALIQPYPLAVAGTPERLDYSPTTRSLTFRWSTARPGGGTYPANTRTVLEAPATVYPDGYRVVVHGGRVTSAPCSSLISVVGSTGARRVAARVVPDDNCGS